MKGLIDTNVFLDVVLQREGFVESSGKVMDLVKEESIQGLMPGQSIPTIYFVVKKYYSHALAIKFLKEVTGFFRVISLTNEIIQSAFSLGFTDFEDALISETAHRQKCDFIVSNNVNDFRKSKRKVFRPVHLIENFYS